MELPITLDRYLQGLGFNYPVNWNIQLTEGEANITISYSNKDPSLSLHTQAVVVPYVEQKIWQYLNSLDMDRNPSPPKELQNNEEIFYGDNVGHTVFSKHWLFTTLMKLIQEVDKHNEGKRDEETEFGVDVDEDLQNELCKLWDMTMDDEVAKFLIDFEAIGIFIGVIGKSKAPRVTEICVGVLGNMACCSEICKLMSNNESLIKLILLLLENTDAPTLVETTRMLLTCLSNASRSPWLKEIESSSNFQHHIKFILQSSTNCALLKNTGQLLDILLDLEEDISSRWTTQDFVGALLEAVKQIGLSDIESLEIFIHVFQLLSTSSKGVESLVHHDTEIVKVIMSYLDKICEDMFAVHDHLNGLLSSVSILSVLISSPEVFLYVMKDEKLIRIFLKVIEVISVSSTVVEKSSEESSQPTDTENISHQKSDNLPSEQVKIDEQTEGDNLNTSSLMCLPQSANRTKITHENESLAENVSEEVELLDQSIKDLLFNISQLMCKKSQLSAEIPTTTYLTLMRYLDSVCSRKRISNLILALKSSTCDEFDPVDIFSSIANSLEQNRLCAIISDIQSGRSISRSDSNQTTDSTPHR